MILRMTPLVIILAVVMVMAVAVAACGSDEAPTPASTTAAPTPSSAPTAAPPPVAKATPVPPATTAPTPAPSATASPTPAPAPTAVPAVAPSPRPPSAPAATPHPTPTPAAQPTLAPAPGPAPTPAPAPTVNPITEALTGVRGVVDPANLGWPREVEGLNGIVSIPYKPKRIITASVGHDEMVLAIVPKARLVGVGSVTKNQVYSNVWDLAQEIDEISRDPETIIAKSPDVIVTSPFFPAETVDALANIGIPTLQTELKQGAEERINAILLMGYIFGEEARAIEFADEIRDRHDALATAIAGAQPQSRVLALTRYGDNIWTAGLDSTEGSVIVAAGGVNAAAEAGVTGNQTTSLEGVIAMAPEVIIIPQPAEFRGGEFRDSLLANEALALVPAIQNDRVFVVESKHYTTLSFWNILGAESLARMLWPDRFPGPSILTFSLAE